MAEAKKTTRKKAAASDASDAPKVPETESKADDKQPQILTTGLEDYGRWRSIYNDHQRDPKEKPFRRGRIFC